MQPSLYLFSRSDPYSLATVSFVMFLFWLTVVSQELYNSCKKIMHSNDVEEMSCEALCMFD